MSDYTIRPATQKDIESIIDLCKEHAQFESSDYDKTGKAEKISRHLFSGTSSIKCLVVETAGGIKGYATFMPEFSTWDASYYMHMDCLYLKPELRRKGIGREIITFIFSEAKAMGCVNVQWQTPEENLDAIEFYKKVNAVPKKKVRFFLDCKK